MKDRKIKVAIYSGEIPSTTFIERLIVNLSIHDLNIYLFGSLHEAVRYSKKNILIVGNRPGGMGIIEAAYRFAKLKITEPDKYNTLKKYLKGGPLKSMGLFRLWQRYAPVVLHLPDIFHIQWAKAAGDWTFLKELFGVRLVLSLRGTHINYSPLADEKLASMYQLTFPKYDVFHGVSKAIVEESLKWGVTRDKAVIIYSGLEPATLSLNNESHEVLKILVVGRMHWIKGYHYLLDAARILKDRQITFSITLVAAGEMPEEILYQIHELGLQDTIIWKGRIPFTSVKEEMHQHDVLVLPSLEEGIANVVLEAMNAGLPVISTDCGGMREVIADGVNGFIIPVRQPMVLAEAIHQFQFLPKASKHSIQLAAHRTISEKFSSKSMSDAFVRLYLNLPTCISA